MKALTMKKSLQRFATSTLGLLIVTAFMVSAGGCASRLPAEKKINRPEGGVQVVDLSLVNFLNIETGETVNLKAYMEANNRDYMLLTFGSRGCTACNEKGFVLRDSVIGQHPLYQTEEGKHFEIMGINTDPDPLPRVKQFVLTYQFQSFLRWNDPKGKAMIEFFMPEGRAFGVPLTVMLTRQGIKWSITNDQGLHVDEIMAKVEETLNIGNSRPRPTPTPSPSPSPSKPPVVLPPISGLDAEAPGRLRSVSVTTCDGEVKDLAQVMSVRDYYVIQAEGKACGAACLANREQLAALKAGCQGEDGTGCGVMSLSQAAADLPLDPQACGTGMAARGGGEFFSSFHTHFSWNHAVSESYEPEWSMTLSPVDGPLTFVFSKDGKLAFSKEGALVDGELSNFVATGDFNKRPRGPDFQFFGKEKGDFKLADLREKSKYTVVSAYGTFCGSCIEEMKFWSKPGELKDFCAARPEDCQVQMVNSDYPGDGQTFDQFLTEAADVLATSGINLPLAMDPINPNQDNGYLKRFFSGYLMAEFFYQLPVEKRGDPRTVIYDREGRIVGMFVTEGVKEPAPDDPNPPAPHVDPVMSRLKELLGVK